MRSTIVLAEVKGDILLFLETGDHRGRVLFLIVFPNKGRTNITD